MTQSTADLVMTGAVLVVKAGFLVGARMVDAYPLRAGVAMGSVMGVDGTVLPEHGLQAGCS